jgi:glutamate dehydrogenase/leucine dehydrogenase
MTTSRPAPPSTVGTIPLVGVFDRVGSEYEQVVFGHDPETGLRTIIAIYSTARGPALGGTRMWPYPTEEDALADALRLGKAMAYKAACANLPLGGGKAVIIGDSRRDKSEALLRAYGRQVERLGGAYITTADVGTTVADLDVIAQSTRFVTGTSAGSGDPSPVTANGVWHGLRAVAEAALGQASLEGRHVVVQGVGKVGSGVARALRQEGAHVTVADINADAARALAEEIGADVVAAADVKAVPCDVFSPCALGPVVTDDSLSVFKCLAIAGAANNQLERPDLARALADAGILYAPDYVINAGGLINVEDELHGYDSARAHAKAEAIAGTLRDIFRTAAAEGVTPSEAADRLAESRITAAR